MFPGNIANAARQLRELPASPSGGGWSNLGLIAKPGRYPLSRLAGHTPPDGVDHVRLSLHMVLPSAAIVVAGFVLDETVSDAITQALTKEYTSYGTRIGTATSIHDPELQKARAIRQIRRDAKRRCSDWLSRYVRGGVFATAVLEDGRFPNCEFWTTTRERPLDPDRTNAGPSYMRIVNLDKLYYLWKAEKLEGLRFSMAESDDPEDRGVTTPSYSLLLAGREDEIFANDDMNEYGGNNLNGWINKIENDMALVTASWTLLWAVRAHEVRIAEVRDELMALDVKRVVAAVRRLQATEAKLVRVSGDALPLAADVVLHKNILLRHFHLYSGLDFEEVETLQRPRGPWIDNTVDWTVARAERLTSLTRDVRDFEAGIGNALTARANLRLQRWIAVLTIVLLMVGLLTLLVTAIALRHELQPLWDWIGGLGLT